VNLKLLPLKAKFMLITCTLFLTVLILDYLVFQILFFKFPNEMEWDTSHWYNFAHLRNEVKRETQSKKVLIVGSSVALYSVLPDSMFAEKDKIQTMFYSHVAMTPTDFYYYKDDIKKAKPDLVVYLLNFADLQWEYVKINQEKFEFDKDLWLKEYAVRYPVRIYYPFEFLRDFYHNLDKKQTLSLASKSLLYVNRYRSFLFDPIETWIDNHSRSGRSFQRYSGSMPFEGIWSKGWTKLKTTLSCDMERPLDDSIFTLKNDTKLEVIVFKSEKDKSPYSSQILSFPKNGWNVFPWDHISLPPDKTTVIIQIAIKSEIGTAKEANLYQYGKDYPVGVRLSHYFCSKPNYENSSYLRSAFFDESRFSEMSADEYEEDYHIRIKKDAENRPELLRLNTLRRQKMAVRDIPFQPWFEYDQIVRISNFFKENEIPFTIILSPENPIESNLYIEGLWFDEFKKDLAKNLKKNGYNFFDHTSSIKEKQYFFDPHHMTYDGAKTFNPIVKQIIESQVKADK
jgi:hypothetical protein